MFVLLFSKKSIFNKGGEHESKQFRKLSHNHNLSEVNDSWLYEDIKSNKEGPALLDFHEKCK